MTLSPAPACSVMFWNIYEGWHDHLHSGEPTLAPQRVLAASRLIQALNPDVVVLNEALWCRPHAGRHIDYAGLLGYAHQLVDTYDGPWGNVILSKTALIDPHRFRIHNRGGLRAQVETASGLLGVATYHPHPSRYPAHKAADVASLLPPTLEGAWMVGGDFNAISPEDGVDEVTLVQQFARFSAQPATDAARFTEGGRRVFAALKAQGFRDAFPVSSRQATLPTRLKGNPDDSLMRIDHAWVNPQVQVDQAQVVRHPWADTASDHYPLLLRVRPQASPASDFEYTASP